jgi:hypothetical protein
VTDIDIQRLSDKLDNIKDDVVDIKKRLDSYFVTKIEFAPVKNLVYGMVGIIMLLFLSGVAALIWRVAK